LAKRVDNHLHVIVQEDDMPGIYISEDGTLGNYNNMLYLKVSKNLDVSVNEIANHDFPFAIYPNPTNNNFVHLSYDLKDGAYVTVNIYNILGEKIDSRFVGYKSQGKNQYTLQQSDLSNGVYFVEVSTGKVSSIQKLIIQ
jgi:hypothetical protein